MKPIGHYAKLAEVNDNSAYGNEIGPGNFLSLICPWNEFTVFTEIELWAVVSKIVE